MVALSTSVDFEVSFENAMLLTLNYLLAASFREKMNGDVAPCNCVPALKMSLYAGWPASAIALAM
jgi:hypothetical protein